MFNKLYLIINIVLSIVIIYLVNARKNDECFSCTI